MENNSFKIISYLSDERGFERTYLVYDILNKRIIEKWIAYQLANDESKFIITDRYAYVYNRKNILYKIIEIEKGNDEQVFGHSLFNDNNEYCHAVNRSVNMVDLGKKIITTINYTRTNHIGVNKNFFLRSLKLLTCEIEDRVFNTRVNYLLKRNQLYIYNYNKNDFLSLKSITKYMVLLDLRFINRIISDIPIFQSVPDLFLKIKIMEELCDVDEECKKLIYNRQDYFWQNNLDASRIKCFVHNSVLIEDLFIKEMYDVRFKYNSETNTDEMVGPIG
jgi:hypothetical protein